MVDDLIGDNMYVHGCVSLIYKKQPFDFKGVRYFFSKRAGVQSSLQNKVYIWGSWFNIVQLL